MPFFRSDAAEQRPDAQPGQDADDERSQGSSVEAFHLGAARTLSRAGFMDVY